MILPFLVVAPSEKGGRGIFSSTAIKAGTTVEISPVLVLSTKERAAIESTKLTNYIFEWGRPGKKICVALGYVSLYNHDYNANCTYDMDYENETMSIITVRDIKKGEELTLNYNGLHNDATPVWFNAR